MVLSALFLIVNYKESKYAKYATLYLLVWGAFLLFHLLVNHFSKPNFYLIEEIKFLVKLSYFNVILLNFGFMFKYFSKDLQLKRRFIQGIVISTSIIGMVMFISIVTNTSLKSYEYTKTGFTGWFFAGNELSGLLAIILPITLYFAIMMTKEIKHLYLWIPFMLGGYSLLMIGTKVGYGAVVITLGIGLASILISFFLKKGERKLLKVNGAFTAVLLIILGIITPIVPVFQNTYAHIELLDTKEKEQQENIDPEEEEVDEPETSRIENIMLSSRDLYLYQYEQYYLEAPVGQKIIGMGYGGNFEKTPKMIEMDYSDIFYSMGLIGAILYFLPMLYFGFNVIKRLMQRFSAVFTPHNALIISSIFLGLGIAHFAGHVFTSPGVSIYLAIAITYLHHHLETT
ncbi:hypothetical protein KP78_13580 [Jeotgalibacillus soli]|uniref:Uncharacterized protein n=2 Tax=Jeotgalibacillus soli TaxID=889306 RepID=A0A0C2RIA0_9BACL|nr:hypothetical protein KP78_13580 [Jeotgalibacillus soli]